MASRAGVILGKALIVVIIIVLLIFAINWIKGTDKGIANPDPKGSPVSG